MADLRKHERIHTGEKPHTCDHCDRTFADPSALRKHERRHLQVSAPQQHFRCLGCDKTFQKEEAFFKHANSLHPSAKCPGKPSNLVEDAFSEQAVVRFAFACFGKGCTFILRCLQCKVTLDNSLHLKSHLENPLCQGPVYVKVRLS